MSNICPAIKASCKHFDGTIKNKCGIRKPLILLLEENSFVRVIQCLKKSKI